MYCNIIPAVFCVSAVLLWRVTVHRVYTCIHAVSHVTEFCRHLQVELCSRSSAPNVQLRSTSWSETQVDSWMRQTGVNQAVRYLFRNGLRLMAHHQERYIPLELSCSGDRTQGAGTKIDIVVFSNHKGRRVTENSELASANDTSP